MIKNFSNRKLSYRPEIDGLRALAVIPVILFHANKDWCSGGYIGVDVFFVISGYLITSIICRELANDSFSIISFYERRVRRILPAFIAVTIVTFIASWLIYLPSAFKGVGRGFAAASLSVSNILYWMEDGYFASASEEKPFLHTWSLGVEEQFYIFLPLILIGIRKLTVHFRATVLIILATFSLGFSIYLMPKYSSAVFFLLPFRAWELLIGSILAIGFIPVTNRESIRSAASFTGVATILLCSFFYTIDSPFPGLYAVLPCLGAAAIIYSQGNGLAARLLSARPIVFVGKISYSLYLWHWPFLVLTRHLDPLNELSNSQTLLILVAAFAAAVLSWKFIEQPFRKPSKTWTRKRMFCLSLVILTLFAVIGISIHLLEGVETRFSPQVARLDNGEYIPVETKTQIANISWKSDLGDQMFGARCQPKIAVFGDSHSIRLARSLGILADSHNESVQHFYANATAPILNARFMNNNTGRQHNETSFQKIENSNSIEFVVLVSRWSVYVKGPNVDFGTYEQDRSGVPTIRAINSRQPPSREQALKLFEDGIQASVERLQKAGKKVALVYPIPEVGFHVPRTMARMIHLGQDVSTFTRPAEYYFNRQKCVFEVFDNLDAEIFRVYPHEIFIRGDIAIVHEDQKPLYLDDDHLNIIGSEKIATELKKFLWQNRSAKD